MLRPTTRVVWTRRAVVCLVACLSLRLLYHSARVSIRPPNETIPTPTPGNPPASDNVFQHREVMPAGVPDKALRSGRYWPPKPSLFRISGPLNKTLTVIVVDCENLQYADNLASSIIRNSQVPQFRNAYNFAMVPLDEITYQVLLHTYPDNVVPPPPKKVNRRPVIPSLPWILNSFLDRSVNVLFSTPKGVWFKDVMEDMLTVASGEDAETVLVTAKQGPSTALFYLKKSAGNRKFLSTWHQKIMDSSTDPYDDIYFYEALAGAQKKGLKTKILNTEEYPHPTIEEYMSLNERDQARAGMVYSSAKEENLRKVFERRDMWNPSGKLERSHISYTCEASADQGVVVSESAIPSVSNTNANRERHQYASRAHRTLVILLGGVRGGEPTWKSLYRHLLEPNNADLALLLGPSNTNSSLYQRAKYQWDFPEYDDWNQAFDDHFRDKAHNEWKEILARKGAEPPFGSDSSGAILGFARALLATRLEKDRLLDKYDWFVVTRPDQYYQCDVDLTNMDTETVWIPTGEDWGGICDRFLAAGKNWIMKTLNSHIPAIQNPHKYASLTNNERFMARRWTEEGVVDRIKRFRRVMFTAYAQGDATRFTAEGMKEAFVEDGVIIQYKYEDEYYQAASCAAVGGAIDPLAAMRESVV